MKVEGQINKLLVKDKNVQQNKDQDAVAQKKVDPKTSTRLSNVKGTNRFTMTKMQEKIKAQPDIDMDKVNAIKAKLKSGEYKVDTEKLATNLIKNSLIEDI